jgi:hypothetical protein
VTQLSLSLGRWCIALALLATLSGCPSKTTPTTDAASSSRFSEVVALFDSRALVTAPVMVDCELSGGAQARCVSVTVKTAPETVTAGPWCPRNIADGPEKGGIWLDRGLVHKVDGAFVSNMATFYNDKAWQMFDAKSGSINVTDSKAACEAAARPDVDPKYVNHCVECQTAYLPTGSSMTYVIPLSPVSVTGSPRPLGPRAVGVTFSGLRLDGSAPVDAILGAHTLAPFDDCGGHVNLHVGYHVHAVTPCMKTSPSKDPSHAAVIGLAMDGWPIHSRLDANGTAPADLDACRGHQTQTHGYHYHVAAAGANAILSCHAAQTGCAQEDPLKACTKSDGGPPSGGPPPSGPQPLPTQR